MNESLILNDEYSFSALFFFLIINASSLLLVIFFHLRYNCSYWLFPGVWIILFNSYCLILILLLLVLWICLLLVALGIHESFSSLLSIHCSYSCSLVSSSLHVTIDIYILSCSSQTTIHSISMWNWRVIIYIL